MSGIIHEKLHSDYLDSKGCFVESLPRDPKEKDEYEQKLKALSNEIVYSLAKMKMNDERPNPLIDLDSASKNYRFNTKHEDELLKITERFIKCFQNSCPNRAEPFLIVFNECGTKKLITTYLEPVSLHYYELFEWQSCSKFIADFMKYKCLECPIRTPIIVPSPKFSVEKQEGNSLDLSMILYCLLSASLYDVYIVHGYASLEVCEMDERNKSNPPLDEDPFDDDEQILKETPKEVTKYIPKPPMQFYSKYDKTMGIKHETCEENNVSNMDEDNACNESNENNSNDDASVKSEKEIKDPFFNQRVHFWILVKAGKNGITCDFFIEPSTGERINLNSPDYRFVEAVWNSSNFWINLRSKKQNALFDLKNEKFWMKVFPIKLNTSTAENNKSSLINDQIVMPVSWTEPFNISSKDFYRRFPNGAKLRCYSCLKYQRFAPFYSDDGLISEIDYYSDKDYKSLIKVEKVFKNRNDNMKKQIIDRQKQTIHEYFLPFRKDSLKEHIYNVDDSKKPDDERTMIFYSDSRLDGLNKLVRTTDKLTEEYTAREDRLCERTIRYHNVSILLRLAAKDNSDFKILSIEETFSRNYDLSADQDIYKKRYLIEDETYLLKFQTADDCISHSLIDIIKPKEKKKGHGFVFTHEMWSGFQACTGPANYKLADLYLLVANLIESEAQAIASLQNVKQEIQTILDSREQEKAALKLKHNIYEMQKVDILQKEEKQIEEEAPETQKLTNEISLDYLKPYLAKLGYPEILNDRQANKVYNDCLTDYQKLLNSRGERIRTQLKNDRTILKEKQNWFKIHQIDLNKQELEEYLQLIKKMNLVISVSESRLKWHTETKETKISNLKKKLKDDPRLRDHV
ncbi:dynein regulatory complex subunit 7-like [Centruroides sculpturatus]|uniref:dynein regulatory complex subunit 7-like n=1 Tax=Centruroides sculpturatus TaxID=218467 RepID=UPI000C6E9B31|nr:dynein regulatory complex subunit 7-like [Centruroides sculpturatus]